MNLPNIVPSLTLTDIVFESVLRAGFQYLRNNPIILTQIFNDLNYLPKFGQKEVNRIVSFFTSTEINVVKNFPLTTDNLPAISIHLLSDVEDIPLTFLDDDAGDNIVPFTLPQQLNATILIPNVQPTSYDSNSGYLYFSNALNLASVSPGMVYVDSTGIPFKFATGAIPLGTDQAIVIGVEQNPAPNLTTPGSIQTPVTYDAYTIRSNIDTEELLIGVHTQDRLTTIYLYSIVKYIMLSRKKDFISMGLLAPTFKGSDFARNESYVEPVFTRFITFSTQVENHWQSTQNVPIIDVSQQIQVPAQDPQGNPTPATNQDLGLINQTITLEPTNE